MADDNILDDPRLRFLNIQDLVSKMSDSTFNMILWHQHKDLVDLMKNPELAIQIGIGLSLDLPTIFIVKKGDTLPSHMARYADYIVTDVDYAKPESWQPRLQELVIKMEGDISAARASSGAGAAGTTREADNADSGETG